MSQSHRNRVFTLKQKWHRLLWEQDLRMLSYPRSFLLRQLQTVSLVTRDFLQDRCMLRASALTYSSLLAIVPLLALTFALLKAFGVQNTLEPLILDKLNVGSHEVVTSLLTYVNNTQVGKLGAFGLLFLLIAVTSLLSNIEDSFNHVWGVKGLRPLIRRFSDYLSVLLVGPVLLISAISMTSSLTSHKLVQRLIDMEVVGSLILTLFKMGPYLLMWIAFAVLYVFMSNTRVEWSSAFAGGIIGGTLWQLAQWSYVNFQVGVAKYNAIYGTMAALPIFMIWVYLSWNIVLLGLEFTYARQNLRTWGRDLHGYEVNRSSYERVALILLLSLATRFYRAMDSASKESLSRQLGIPPRLCEHILAELVELGFVSETSGGGRNIKRYQLGRAAEALSVSYILSRLRGHGIEVLHLKPHFVVEVASQSLADMALTEQKSGAITLKTLVDQCTRSDEASEKSES
ncbi:YhjD/YihY/BrkB family envelope integrity protein [Geopsychrobacter electrodiphilus]|uniref:YhjD/YihY/BrkB family envelope integrity protein n=1 Tax=Geopsychrobacter electrodiphilus TaxID=225196 RepID=UPI00035E9D72|nr:YhjD/YihY/BrkB family envelope integrity protein [Geopsychrobacter electrodiphilus]